MGAGRHATTCTSWNAMVRCGVRLARFQPSTRSTSRNRTRPYSARRVVFVRGPSREGTDDFDLFEFTLRADGSTTEPLGLPFSGPEYGEGDPQLARDGSFLIFTRWDHRVGWQQTCDLYLSFRTALGWTEPVPLTELNSPTPDYAAAVSPDSRWLYYRSAGRYLRRPLKPVLDSALARTR